MNKKTELNNRLLTTALKLRGEARQEVKEMKCRLKEQDALRTALQRIIEHYDMRSEIYTNYADLAGQMADIARCAITPTKRDLE